VDYTHFGHYKLYIPKKRITIIVRDTTIINNKFYADSISNNNNNNNNKSINLDLDIKSRKSKFINQQPYIKTRAQVETKIASDPNHQIEIQIPKDTNNINTIYTTNNSSINNNNNNNDNSIKQYIYTISDTIIDNICRPIAKSLLPFTLTIANLQKSSNIKDTIKNSDWLYWEKVCLEENTVLVNQYTWNIVDIPPNIKPISGRWISKIKSIIKRINNNNNNNNNNNKSYITNGNNTIRYKTR